MVFNFLQSTIFQPRMNHVMRLHIETTQLEIVDIAKEYTLMND